MRSGRSVELSVFSLLSVLDKENLGEPHVVFAGGERYVSPRFADVAAQVLQQDLRAAGLGERDDYLEFVDLLGLVQRAGVEYYGWVTAAEESYSLLAAIAGRSAVFVVRRGERVAFERVEPAGILKLLAYRLPDVRPAVGDSFAVSHVDFHAKARAQGSVMRRAAIARPEVARRLDALLAAPRVSLAKLYSAKRVAGGERVRAAQWLTVLDLARDGRWVLSVGERRGQKWINAAPGSDEVVVARLEELARSVG
jgi:hypothetical protein